MADREDREQMIEWDLARRGIVDPRVLDAFRRIPREAFVPPDMLGLAYADEPLPIGEGQTISQPYVVALTAEALQLRGHERVLDVGTGSGYAAAILSLLAAEVVTIERFSSLADAARERLARLGFDNVRGVCGDGSIGWPERAPYEAIAVAASAPVVPDALRGQLAVGGRLVIPVGRDSASQVLMRVTREGPTTFREESLGEVRFVPLIGAQGWGDKATIGSSDDSHALGG